MGGISAYEVNVETRGDNGIYLKDRKITDVQGMPDVDLVVREKRRVVDVDGTTTFQIRLRNYGTKEATKILIRGKVSDNLVIARTAGGPEEEAFRVARRPRGEVPDHRTPGTRQGDDHGNRGESDRASAQDRHLPRVPHCTTI